MCVPRSLVLPDGRGWLEWWKCLPVQHSARLHVSLPSGGEGEVDEGERERTSGRRERRGGGEDEKEKEC